MGLSELSQLIGYCLVSKVKFGALLIRHSYPILTGFRSTDVKLCTLQE